MGRPPAPDPESKAAPAQDRPRGTLQIPSLLESIPGLRGAIAINNVGNAFTPQGSVDPLSISSLGVGLYHAGRVRDAEALYECVSSGAREAIGENGGGLVEGGEADLVIFGRMGREGGEERMVGGVRDVVCDPPRERKTVFGGSLVC